MQTAPKRTTRRTVVAAASLTAAAVLGTAGVATAATTPTASSTATPTASSTPSSSHLTHHPDVARRLLVRQLRAQHGAVGRVSAVGAGSVQVRSAKGRTWTFDLTSTTRVRVHHRHHERAGTLADVVVGERVLVRAVGDHGAKTTGPYDALSIDVLPGRGERAGTGATPSATPSS